VRSAIQGRYRGLVVNFGDVLSISFDGAPSSFWVREGLAADTLSWVFSMDVGAKGLLVALAADRIALPPAECVFVDDVERYLPPARALGMAVIHATDPTTTVTESTLPPPIEPVRLP
jgi:hypothetical protein